MHRRVVGGRRVRALPITLWMHRGGRGVIQWGRCMTHPVAAAVHLAFITIAFALSSGSGVAWAGSPSSPNLALNQPVVSSGANWGSFKPAALTDGDPATFTHPAADTGTLGFYYEVDLGGTRHLDRVLLRNRDDGCCSERLTQCRVEIWTDGGGASPGRLQWTGHLRADASNSGVGGIDIITADLDPGGDFSGRFVRVINESGAAYNPQLAEIEVYGGELPSIRRFAAGEDSLRSGEATMLQWEIANATGASISPGGGGVNAASGTMFISPTATTTYTLIATNINGASSATVTIGVDVPLAPPVLTEFVASNSSGLRDADGDTSDWIELRNPNRFSLSLTGYSLTDDPTLGTRWLLPDARIPPRGHLLVFASGKDRSDPTNELHANFQLRASGGYLALVDRDGRTVLGQYPSDYPATAIYPRQPAGVGYGLGSDGKIGYLRPATPGATNGPAFAGVVADTKFSRDRGIYDAPVVIELTTATAGAVIRYTTDRTAPTSSHGQVYAGPVTITNTTILRSAAFKDGWAPTDVDTQTYLFPSNIIASSVMRKAVTTNAIYRPQLPQSLRDLPTFSLVTTATINDTTEVGVSLEWIPSSGEATNAPARQIDCGIQQFGGAYTDFAKKSFRLYFRAEYGASRFRAPLFAGFDRGLEAASDFDQIELRNCSHDMVMRGFYLSNIFTDDTLLAMGQLNPHGRWVHLYLNGTYWGVYHLRERWGAAMHQSYLGGPKEVYESINGNWNVGGWADPGTPYDGTGATWTRLKSIRKDFTAARQLLDVPQFVDYMIMWMFGGAEDEYRCVGPSAPGSGFKFYLNDADGWLCIPQYCASGNRTARGSPGRQAGDGPGSLFSMLFAGGDPEYRLLLADRIQKALFNDGALTPARNAARLRLRCAELERAFLAESARWGYLSPTEWVARRDSVLNSWFPSRTGAVLSEFRGAGFYPALAAPTLSRQGGRVTNGFAPRFVGPNGASIWYTTDGSDPRLPGGAVSPSAVEFKTGTSGGAESVVPAGARWRWFTDATGLGSSDLVAGNPAWSAANWKHPDFIEGAWSEGVAQLGYGEGDEATVIPFGQATAKWTSSYFRHRFVVSRLTDVIGASLRLKCDDGAIVYLNGSEILRSSMPIGTVTGTTLASNASDDGQGFASFALPSNVFSLGTNTLAVELHQSGPTTSDASFDLELILDRALAPGPPAFQVGGNSLVKARARNATQWSALNEAFFQTSPEPLAPGEVLVRELLFHPPSTNASEYLELQNISPHAVNLRGASLTNAVRFRFPDDHDTALAPGGRLVLVNDMYGFRKRHGLEIQVAGIFSGRLKSNGETLTLLNAGGVTVTSFRLDAGNIWSETASSGGHSLVLAHPELGLENPEAWRASVQAYGTPGTSDATVFVGDPMADADHDGVPALLEYAMGTSDNDAGQGPHMAQGGIDGEGWFTLTLPRSLAADDVRIRVEVSDDLQLWSPAVPRVRRVTGEGQGLETWGTPPSARRAVFLRASVQRW